MSGSGPDGSTNSGSLGTHLARLEHIVKTQTGLPELPFNRGCSEEDLRRLETVIQAPLPDDYKALLRCVDGQSDWGMLTFPPERLSLLSVEKVIEIWREFVDICDDELMDELVCDDRIRWTVCHPDRIPIAQNELAGAYLCIDKIPGPAGRLNQLVFNVNSTDCVVLEECVTLLIANYVTTLETGVAEVGRKPPEYGDGYEFTAGGRYFDFDVYQELKSLRLK